jgi:hypothetical protein
MLAGIISIAGSWYISSRQIDALVLEERLSARREAYQSLVENLGQKESPQLSELMRLGSLAGRAVSDAEIQELEDRISIVVGRLHSYDTYIQLSSHLGVVRLHGSEEVNKIADDLLTIVAFRYYEVDLDRYPRDLVESWERWKFLQKEGISYGWETKVSPDERFTMIAASLLFDYLLESIRSELRQAQIQ